MDIKRALCWIRTHAAVLGGDPDFIICGGESAGAHLACLLALTPNIAYLQPGNESIDTRVQGCVDLYAPHDFTDSHLHYRSHEDPHSLLGGVDVFLQLMVMRTGLHEPTGHAEYSMASPYYRLKHFDAPAREIPPFFGTHGTADDLVPVGDSDEFYAALREKREQSQKEYDEQRLEFEQRLAAHVACGSAGPAPLPPSLPFPPHDVYVRVPGGSHAFNNCLGPRSFALNDAVTAWMLSARAHFMERKQRANLMAPGCGDKCTSEQLQLLAKL
jgi:acetyl esterase/lipase